GYGFGAAAGGVLALHAAGVRDSERSHEGRVLAVALTVSSEARVTGDVQHRCEAMSDPQGSFLPADDLADRALEVDVPARAPAHAGGEARRTGEEGPAEPLHMEDRRNPVAGPLHRRRLD